MKLQAKIPVEDIRENSDTMAALLKSLAHPQRLLILCFLSEGPKTVGELERICGASQSAVSQFLQRMKRDGLVSSKRRGLFVYYRLTDQRVMKLTKALHSIYCRQ